LDAFLTATPRGCPRSMASSKTFLTNWYDSASPRFGNHTSVKKPIKPLPNQ